MRVDSLQGEVILHPVDEGKVGVAADSWEFDQLIKDFAGRKSRDGGHAMLSCAVRADWRGIAGWSRRHRVTQGKGEQAACGIAKNL
jgi:hypothetical protein